MRGRGLFLVLLGILLATTGVPAASADPGPAVQVNDDGEADYNHIFPDLVADPANPSRLVLVDVKRLSRGVDSYAGTCLVHTSSDGGETWSSAALPVPAGTVCRREPPPELAFGSGGVLYASYYVIPETGAELTRHGRILVARSRDAGATFEAPVAVTPALTARLAQAAGAGAAHPQSVALAADEATKDVYVAWSVQRDRPLLWTSRSGDEGRTFSEPTFLTVPKADVVRNHFSTQLYDDAYSVALAVGGGRVFFTAAIGGCNMAEQNVLCWTYLLLFSVSEDRGATWREPVQLASPTYYDTGSTGAYPRPSMAVDRRSPQHLYIAYDDGIGGGINYDVHLLHSSDGGRTWAPPLRVADDDDGPGYPHNRPVVAVAPDGRVDVAWYDGRNDPSSPVPCPGFSDGAAAPCRAGRDVYLASSTDHGASFAPNVRVSPSTFSVATREMNAARRSVDAALGSIGLASTAEGASVVWELSRMQTSESRTVAIWDLAATNVRGLGLNPTGGVTGPDRTVRRAGTADGPGGPAALPATGPGVAGGRWGIGLFGLGLVVVWLTRTGQARPSPAPSTSSADTSRYHTSAQSRQR